MAMSNQLVARGLNQAGRFSSSSSYKGASCSRPTVPALIRTMKANTTRSNTTRSLHMRAGRGKSTGSEDRLSSHLESSGLLVQLEKENLGRGRVAPAFKLSIRKKRSDKWTTLMQATGTDSKERTDNIVSPAEEAASRLGVGSADYQNDPDKERGRSPVPEGVHPSVQLLIDVLKEEMPKFFGEEGINLTIYRNDVHFRDPQNEWHTLVGFKLLVYVLRIFFFKGRYVMHDIQPTGEKEITARWTFDLPARFFFWTPSVILTGITKYGVDLESAKLTAHIDYWDNLAGKEQHPVSVSALSSVVKQLQPLTAFNRPLHAPHEVIRKTKYYEIRRYAMDLRDPSATDEETLAIERAEGTLIKMLKKDNIKLKSDNVSVRTIESTWPHKKIEEVYVPVSFTPTVYDAIDFTGAEYWR